MEFSEVKSPGDYRKFKEFLQQQLQQPVANMLHPIEKPNLAGEHNQKSLVKKHKPEELIGDYTKEEMHQNLKAIEEMRDNELTISLSTIKYLCPEEFKKAYYTSVRKIQSYKEYKKHYARMMQKLKKKYPDEFEKLYVKPSFPIGKKFQNYLYRKALATLRDNHIEEFRKMINNGKKTILKTCLKLPPPKLITEQNKKTLSPQ